MRSGGDCQCDNKVLEWWCELRTPTWLTDRVNLLTLHYCIQRTTWSTVVMCVWIWKCSRSDNEERELWKKQLLLEIMTAVHGVGRGETLCKSRGVCQIGIRTMMNNVMAMLWMQLMLVCCTSRGMKCSDGRRENLKMGDIVIKCKVHGWFSNIVQRIGVILYVTFLIGWYIKNVYSNIASHCPI
jgi:hypothetical protein